MSKLEKYPLQAMPEDGLTGAPDGVNSQAVSATGDGNSSAYPNPHTGKAKSERSGVADGFMGHGGQSNMGYHGAGQLGGKVVKPGGNINSGTKTD